jgi:hypothetical protein
MGTIKDVYDLIEKLYSTTKDKQILDALFPIKEKLMDAEKENIGFQKENLELQKRINNLESEVEKIKNKELAQVGVIKKRYDI